jgi:hypothetical protein
MVLHKKHHVLNTIRDAVLNGDSLTQAKSLCIHSGFSKKQINDTLALFDEFKDLVQFENEFFWDLLSFEIFDLALQNKDFEVYIDNSTDGTATFNLKEVPETLIPLLDRFRLLYTCKYSGYNLIIDIPEDHLKEVKSPQAIIDANEFEEILAKKKALGLEGELFVLNEEKERLGSDFHITHTAELNVGAGYDIQSWKDDKSFAKSNMLFIEVKTISTKKEIFLTENEIATAKKLGVNYRLHIVRKIKTKLVTYKVIDNFASYFELNKSDFVIKPTYLLKV